MQSYMKTVVLISSAFGYDSQINEELHMTKLPDICVTCINCESKFPAMPGMEDSMQAMGCAAFIENGKVVGAYGSRVLDMEEAELTGGAEQELTHGQICDVCIVELMDVGKLKLMTPADQDIKTASDEAKGGVSFSVLPCFSFGRYGGVTVNNAICVSIILILGLVVFSF